MDTCPHGDPHPSRCALCRNESLFPSERKTLRTFTVPTVRPVPRPEWFDREVAKARDAARAALHVALPEHGTLDRYVKHGCRCDACRHRWIDWQHGG